MRQHSSKPNTPKQKAAASRRGKTVSAAKKAVPQVAVPIDADLPPWIPTDDRWAELPQSIRDAVLRVLAPAYRRFVLDVPNELERTVGFTLVHLVWLELCTQIQLAMASADPLSLDSVLNNPNEVLDRHLRLTAVKCQTAQLLVKLRVVESELQPSPVPLSLPAPSLRAFPVELPPPQCFDQPVGPQNGNPHSC